MVLALFLVPGLLLADGVFLTDGSVIPGKIIREGREQVVIWSEGKRQTVSRKEVLRVRYGNRYRERMYIYRAGGPPLHVHIVGETRDHYIVRTNLESRRERKIRKSAVVSLSEKRQVQKTAPHKTGSRGQLGFRVGLSIHSVDMPGNITPEVTWNLEPVWFQLYYYSHWFEIDLTWMPRARRYWQDYTPIEELQFLPGSNDLNRSLSDYSRAAVTGYPFRMFNLDLGITLGHLHHRVEKYHSTGPTGGSTPLYSSLHYQALLAGITWRFLERFRIELDLIIPYRLELDYKDCQDPANISAWVRFKLGKPLPGFSFTFTAFVFSNLSLEAGYQFLVYGLELDRDVHGFNNPFGQGLRVYSHRITFAVGYGFDL
jgi:hypothetical protein